MKDDDDDDLTGFATGCKTENAYQKYSMKRFDEFSISENKKYIYIYTQHIYVQYISITIIKVLKAYLMLL